MADYCGEPKLVADKGINQGTTPKMIATL